MTLNSIILRMDIFIGCMVRAGRRRWLEYGNASPMRERLAGLIMFGKSFWMWGENRVAAFGGKYGGVSNSGSTSTVLHSPACPTSPGDSGEKAYSNRAGGRTSGRDGRLRSSMCSKIVRDGRGTRRFCFCCVAKGISEFIRPASGVRSDGASAYSSRGCWTAREAQRSNSSSYSSSLSSD